MRKWLLLVTLMACMGAPAISARAADSKMGGKMTGKMDSKMHGKMAGNPMEGLSAAEVKYMKMKMAKMPADKQKAMKESMMAMTPAARKEMVQKMMKEDKMGGKMDHKGGGKSDKMKKGNM
jgi:hypothetical protein